jgi:cell division protein ZapA
MKTNTETYKVLINGDEFNLVSDETEAHVLKAAERVNAIIKELSAGMSHVDKRKVAVLAALQLASELQHAKNDREKRKQQENSLVAYVDHTIASL